MKYRQRLSARIANRLVQACLFLESHAGYQGLKSQARDLLDNPRSQRKRYFDLFMILLVLSSVALLVYAVENPLEPWMRWFEALAVSVFITEYLGRVWVYSDIHRGILDHVSQAEFLARPFRLGPALRDALRKKWEYLSTPLAVIDLLAILPSYRPIRLLRVLLLFRLFKLFRYSRSVHGMAGILSEKRFEFYTLALFMAFVVLAAGSAVYVFEGDEPGSKIDTYFDAVYWAMVTLSTVGYGDITTVTTEGRVVAMALIVSGIGVLAFSTSIVVSAFQERLEDLREHRVLGELERLHGYTLICGFGEVGQVVATKLSRNRARFAVIDHDPERVLLATRLGYPAVHGDVTDNALLERIGVADRVHTLVCITGDDVKNVFLTLSARRMNEGLRIIARAGKKEVVRKLTLAGANHVVAPFEMIGLIGAEYVGRPVAFEAIHGILHGDLEVILETVRVSGNSPLAGSLVGGVDFAAKRLLLFGIIAEQGRSERCGGRYPLEDGYCFYFKPADDFTLSPGNMLILFGHELSLRHFKRTVDEYDMAP